MSLESKSLTQLRAIWQGLDGKLDWGWDKNKLIRKISEKTHTAVERPQVSVPPEDTRLRTVPPARNLSQSALWDALSNYRDRGLIVTFPTPDTFYMRFEDKEDSGSTRARLSVIIDCAKRILS